MGSWSKLKVGSRQNSWKLYDTVGQERFEHKPGRSLLLKGHHVGAQRGSIPRFGGKRGNHDASKECLFA